MQMVLITIGIVAAIALIHFSYVDFRFRYRDGILWFWRLSPAPPLMWVGRVTITIALLVALAVAWIGATPTFGAIIGGLVVIHIISLILLEVLEPRG